MYFTKYAFEVSTRYIPKNGSQMYGRICNLDVLSLIFDSILKFEPQKKGSCLLFGGSKWNTSSRVGKKVHWTFFFSSFSIPLLNSNHKKKALAFCLVARSGIRQAASGKRSTGPFSFPPFRFHF